MAAPQCSHKAATTAVEATETAAAAVAIDTAWLCCVAARHTPAFFIHPRDTFMPCSAEFFLQHSELRQAMPAAAAAAAAAAPATVVVLPRGGVTAPLLLQAQRRMPAGGRQWLELDPAARVGTPRVRLRAGGPGALSDSLLRAPHHSFLHSAIPSPPPSSPSCLSLSLYHFKDRLDEDAPVYCRAKAVVAGARPGHGSGGRMLEAIELTYLTLYAFNGPYNVGGWSALQTGQHDGDWEHITARWVQGGWVCMCTHCNAAPPAMRLLLWFCRVHPTSGDLLGMWYNAHRSRDGCWVAGHEVRWVDALLGLMHVFQLQGYTTAPAYNLHVCAPPLVTPIPCEGAPRPSHRPPCRLRGPSWPRRLPPACPPLAPLLPGQRPVQRRGAHVAPAPRAAAARCNRDRGERRYWRIGGRGAGGQPRRWRFTCCCGGDSSGPYVLPAARAVSRLAAGWRQQLQQ